MSRIIGIASFAEISDEIKHTFRYTHILFGIILRKEWHSKNQR